MPKYRLEVEGRSPLGGRRGRLEATVAEGHAGDAGEFWNAHAPLVLSVDGRERYEYLSCSVVQVGGVKPGTKLCANVEREDRVYDRDGMQVIGPGPENFDPRNLDELARMLGRDPDELAKELGREREEVEAARHEPRTVDASRLRLRYWGQPYAMDEVQVAEAAVCLDRTTGRSYVHVVTAAAVPAETEVERVDLLLDGSSALGGPRTFERRFPKGGHGRFNVELWLPDGADL